MSSIRSAVKLLIWSTCDLAVIDLEPAGRHSGCDDQAQVQVEPRCHDRYRQDYEEEIAGFSPINPKAYDQVISTLESPVHKEGGIAIMYGSLAPEVSVVKQIAVSRFHAHSKGPAIVFNSEEESSARIIAGEVKAGDTVVIRYEGLKGRQA
jgi:dihydroxy-acid dehydratase